MEILLYILGFITCFYLLEKICDHYFIPSLEYIADRLKISSDVAGATFMAIGTSAPEFAIAVAALTVVGNHEIIGVSTIVGSAIFNILVLIGAAAYVKKVNLAWQPVIRDMLFYAMSVVILILSFQDGFISFFEAISFVSLYVLYIITLFNWRKIYKADVHDVIDILETDTHLKNKKAKNVCEKCLFLLFKFVFPPFKKIRDRYWWVFIVSVLLIAALGWGLVKLSILTAQILGITETVIALVILAIGSSIPDLICSILAAKRGRGRMAVSNAIGSNVFDILIGLGLPWTIYYIFKGPIPVLSERLYSSAMVLFASLLLVFFIAYFSNWKLGKKIGVFLIFCYIVYIVTVLIL